MSSFIKILISQKPLASLLGTYVEPINQPDDTNDFDKVHSSILENIKNNEGSAIKTPDNGFKVIIKILILILIILFWVPYGFLIIDFSLGSLIFLSLLGSCFQLWDSHFFAPFLSICVLVIYFSWVWSNLWGDRVELIHFIEITGLNDQLNSSLILPFKNLKRCNPFTNILTRSNLLLLKNIEDMNFNSISFNEIDLSLDTEIKNAYLYHGKRIKIYSVNDHYFKVVIEGSEKYTRLLQSDLIHDTLEDIGYIKKEKVNVLNNFLKVICLNRSLLLCESRMKEISTGSYAHALSFGQISDFINNNDKIFLIECSEQVNIGCNKINVPIEYGTIVESLSINKDLMKSLVHHNFHYWGSCRLDILYRVLNKPYNFMIKNSETSNYLFRRYRSDINRFFNKEGLGKIIFKTEDLRPSRSYMYLEGNDDFEIVIEGTILDLFLTESKIVKTKNDIDYVVLTDNLKDINKHISKLQIAEDSLNKDFNFEGIDPRVSKIVEASNEKNKELLTHVKSYKDILIKGREIQKVQVKNGKSKLTASFDDFKNFKMIKFVTRVQEIHPLDEFITDLNSSIVELEGKGIDLLKGDKIRIKDKSNMRGPCISKCSNAVSFFNRLEKEVEMNKKKKIKGLDKYLNCFKKQPVGLIRIEDETFIDLKNTFEVLEDGKLVEELIQNYKNNITNINSKVVQGRNEKNDKNDKKKKKSGKVNKQAFDKNLKTYSPLNYVEFGSSKSNKGAFLMSKRNRKMMLESVKKSTLNFVFSNLHNVTSKLSKVKSKTNNGVYSMKNLGISKLKHKSLIDKNQDNKVIQKYNVDWPKINFGMIRQGIFIDNLNMSIESSKKIIERTAWNLSKLLKWLDNIDSKDKLDPKIDKGGKGKEKEGEGEEDYSSSYVNLFELE